MFRNNDLYRVGFKFSTIEQSFLYEDNKSYEENRKELMKAFDIPPLSDGQLRKLGRAGIPHFSLREAKRTPQARETALRVNKMAQECIATEILSLKAAVSRVEREMGSGDDLTRNYSYVRRDDTNAALQFNKKLLQACRDGNAEEIGRLQFEVIEYARKQLGINSEKNVYELMELDGEELLEKYQLISLYGRVLQDSNRILAEYKFTEEQRESILKYRDLMQTAVTIVSDKVSIMANPTYVELDPTYFYGKAYDSLPMSNEDSALRRAHRYPDLRAENPMNSYVDEISNHGILVGNYAMEFLTFKHPALANAAVSKDPESAMSSFLPAVAKTGDGTDMVLLNGRPPRTQTVDAYTAQLQTLAVKADRRLLTGSKQFDTMKRRMDELIALRSAHASDSELADKVSELATAAKEYLAHKGISAPYDHSSILSRGSKNAREQLRMELGAFYYHYATAQKEVLDNVMQAKQEAATADKTEEQKEIEELEQLNPSKMTPERFEEHLKSVYAKDEGRHVIGAMSQKDCKPSDIYKAMAETLEAQVADGMLKTVKKYRDEGKPEEATKFLDVQKRTYTSLAVGLRKFVREKLDHKTVEKFCQTRKLGSTEYLELMMKSGKLERAGVEEYLQGVQAQNAANKPPQAPQQSNQQSLQQVQQTQEQTKAFAPKGH